MTTPSLSLSLRPLSCRHRLHIPSPIRRPSLLSLSWCQNLVFRGSSNGRFWRERDMLLPRKPYVRAGASEGGPEVIGGEGGGQSRIAVGSAVTVVLAVMNRVLYKLALVPMKQYPFFLAQVTTSGYVVIYFSILYVRLCAGIITKEMLALPKSSFVAIGLLEALGVAAGMSAGAMLPGPAIPILSQTFLVWQLLFSILILRREYSLNQILGCLLVAVGVVIAVTSGTTDGKFLSQIEFQWPALMVVSSAFQAAVSILKGRPVDIFVVNSFGSAFQALFVLILLPFLSNMRGTPLAELPNYLRNGAACFINAGTKMEGCDGAPLLPLLFIFVNMAFNISLLNLVKISSAVVASLAATLSVPISIYILTLPLPYIPQAPSLNTFFIIGSALLVLGLILYNLPQHAHHSSKYD